MPDELPLAIRVQPIPTRNEHVDITEIAKKVVLKAPFGSTHVLAAIAHDLDIRNEVGIAKYGTPLQPFNGRDATLDAYQEACDLLKYLVQRYQERASVSATSINHCIQILVALREELMREYGI